MTDDRIIPPSSQPFEGDSVEREIAAQDAAYLLAEKIGELSPYREPGEVYYGVGDPVLKSGEATVGGLFILIIEDRHTDVEAIPYLSLQGAIDEAKRQYADDPTYREIPVDARMAARGWRYCADWSTEGESLRVVESKVRP